MATTNDLQRQIAAMETRIRDLESDNVSRPSRYAAVGGVSGTKYIIIRQVDADSDIFVWVEDAIRSADFADATDPVNFGRYAGVSERNATTPATEQYKMTVDAHLIAKAYTPFVWAGATTRRAPILKAQFVKDNWIAVHPFFGVQVMTFSGDVVIDDCVVEGVS